jgi:O-antigen ligase
MPFQERIEDIDKTTGSNVINQVLYGSLFIIAVIILIPRKNELFNIIKNEKFLFSFVMLSLLSILWSEQSFITFKRIFQIIAIVLTCISFLLYTDSAQEILKPFKYILYPYLILTLIVVLVIPGAKDPQFHTWRGFTSHKNLLGQVSLLSVIFCYIFYKMGSTAKGKAVAIFMLVLSVALLIGSFSSTSILTFAVLAGIGSLLFVDVIFEPIHIGRTVSFILLASIITIIIGVMLWFPEIQTAIPALFGKDITFSGRTDLWEYLLTEVQLKPLLGSGFSAFWVPESHHIMMLYKAFVWLPGQAHNGYLDILLQTGFVGLGLILLTLINYFIYYFKTAKPHPWVLFVFITIIINFQESTILRPGRMIDVILIFSYLLLFVSTMKSFIWNAGEVD